MDLDTLLQRQVAARGTVTEAMTLALVEVVAPISVLLSWLRTVWGGIESPNKQYTLGLQSASHPQKVDQSGE